MTLGEFIKVKRTELGLSRLALATKINISHTELARIENGDRELPSLKSLSKISEGLGVSKEELLKLAGYTSDEQSPVEKAFPSLDPKRLSAVESFASTLSRHGDLKAEEIDSIMDQIDMVVQYAIGKKKDSSKS